MVSAMKTFLALLVALPVLLAFGAGSHVLSRNDVSHKLLAQMNGSRAGRITTQVGCRLVTQGRAHDGNRYACVLVGARASQHAIVTVNGTSWRAEFAPLQG
jgi:hypothetical protein